MRVLVTGAQGFVGRYLVGEILRTNRDAEILGTGRSPKLDGVFTHVLSSTPPARAYLPPELARVIQASASEGRYQYSAADLCDSAECVRLVFGFCPDVIFHLASGLRGDDSLELVRNNVSATTTLMVTVTGLPGRKPRLVLGSSGGVYGRFAATALPLRESQPCEPMDVYSATKLAAEQTARVLGRAHGVPVLVGRIFNVVGPGQDERHVAGRFAAEIHRCATGVQPSLSVGSLDATRDFIDVRDVASALVLLAENGTADTICNIASGEETAVRDVLHTLLACAGVQPRIENQPTAGRANDVPRHRGSAAALRELGFVPRFTLRESLADLYAYYEGRSL